NIKVLKVDPKVRERVVLRLEQLRKERDPMKVRDSLNELRKAAEREDVNIFPYIYEAVRHKATLGEISKTLREVWGEWRAPEVY
ncbi:MAG: methylmalonyl-CoA mutase family protein, partial [Zestosphaera sp.]